MKALGAIAPLLSLPVLKIRGFSENLDERSNWTGHFHWRDPYLYKDSQTGEYYLFICASAKAPANFQGYIGLAVADTIIGPYRILLPAIAISDEAKPWAYYHMERPQIIYRNGKYHLFFLFQTVF